MQYARLFTSYVIMKFIIKGKVLHMQTMKRTMHHRRIINFIINLLGSE